MGDVLLAAPCSPLARAWWRAHAHPVGLTCAMLFLIGPMMVLLFLSPSVCCDGWRTHWLGIAFGTGVLHKKNAASSYLANGHPSPPAPPGYACNRAGGPHEHGGLKEGGNLDMWGAGGGGPCCWVTGATRDGQEMTGRLDEGCAALACCLAPVTGGRASTPRRDLIDICQMCPKRV